MEEVSKKLNGTTFRSGEILYGKYMRRLLDKFGEIWLNQDLQTKKAYYKTERPDSDLTVVSVPEFLELNSKTIVIEESELDSLFNL